MINLIFFIAIDFNHIIYLKIKVVICIILLKIKTIIIKIYYRLSHIQQKVFVYSNTVLNKK